MGIGRIGSFATVAPIQGNPIGDAMKQVEDNAFKYRAEQRLADEKEKLAKEKADAELETDLGKIKSDTTKFSTQNALIIDAMTKLKNGIGEKARQMKEGKISRLDYNIYKTNAESQISLIDQSAKRINAQADAYAKDVADGKIPSGFEENALNFGGAYDKNNIALELQPDGTMIANVYDDNGNILDKGDLGTIGQNAFTPVYKYDLDKDKQEFIKAYPKVLNERFVGNTKVGTKGISPEIEKAMDMKIEAIVKDRNALAIKAKEITGKPNSNVKDPETIEEVRKRLKAEFMGMYAPEKTVDEAVQRSAENRQARKDAKEEIKKTISDFVEVKDEPTNKIFTTRNKKIISFKEKDIPFKNLGGSGSGLNSGFVNAFALQNDNKVVAIGKALVDKGQKFKVGGKSVDFTTASEMAEQGNEEAKAALDSYNIAANYKRFVRRVEGDELGMLASQSGYASDKELVQELKKLNNVKEGTSQNKPSSTQEKANTQEDFNSKWSKLKTGQTLVGPDGKTYKKK